MRWKTGINSLLALTAGLSLLGCNSITEKPSKAPQLETLYDSVIYDANTRQPIALDTLISQLQATNVIFIGEFHGSHGSHLLQAKIQAGLFKQNPQQVLTLEQFNRDQQAQLNQYLDDEIGETYLVNETPAWSNYQASYRPLVEFAKQAFLPVIAANAPADIVRCVGRHGEEYTQKLDAEATTLIATHPFTEISGYREQFDSWLETVGKPHGKNHDNRYAAQLLRDNTMAESIAEVIQSYPQHQIVHLNGAFHSNQHSGTVQALQQRLPTLNIKVISPIEVEDSIKATLQDEKVWELGDYIYLVKPQPVQYRQASYRKQQLSKQFQKADQKQCLP